MDMYGMKKMEAKMDVCGYGEQDLLSFTYLPQTLNSNLSNTTSTSDIIQPSGDNYLSQVYDPVAATDILTAAVQEIQKSVENSIELKSNEMNTHTLPHQEKLDQTNGVNQHPIDIQKRQTSKMMSPQHSATKKNRKKRKVDSLEKDKIKKPAKVITEMKNHFTLNLSRTKSIIISEAKDIIQIHMIRKDQSSLSLGEMKTLFKNKEKLIDSVLEVIIADVNKKKKKRLRKKIFLINWLQNSLISFSKKSLYFHN